MHLIEQAIFTSAETDRSAGYQVVAASPGVSGEDARALAVWGPSHDAMLDSTPGALSYNFHPLPSGAYCVSRTTPAGWEYSGRGARVYTQCLIVPPEVLKRFANNPFALMRAAAASGSLIVYDELPSRLQPLRLSGGTPPVDSALLSRLATSPGADWMAAIVQAALDSVGIAVVGKPAAEQVIAGLINCLPPECRTEFSFSTGLKFSSRRRFRVVALPDDMEEQRRIERLYNVTVLDLCADPPDEFARGDTWARFVHRVLKSGRTSLLATQLSNRRMEIAPEDLSALGLQFLEELDGLLEGPNGPPLECDPPGQKQRAHEAHRRFEQETRAPAVTECKPTAASKLIAPSDPRLLPALEKLDNLVYEAIAGQTESIGHLKSLWPRLRHELGDEMLARSREQYLRYALAIWEKCAEPDGLRHPERAIQSLDVLCVLFDEA